MRNYNLKGNLKIGQYKTISCDVQAQVDQIIDDEWVDFDDEPEYDPKEYIDGVRFTGELSFDSIPLNNCTHPVKMNAVGELVVRRPNDDLNSKLNILIGQRSAIVDVVQTKIKRYFWSFCVIGKPKWDNLCLFPENYRGVNMNRIFTCTNFRGKYWPAEVSSIVIASDRREAKKLLDAKLREASIPFEGDYDLEELSLENKGAVILTKGDE